MVPYVLYMDRAGLEVGPSNRRVGDELTLKAQTFGRMQ